MAPIIKTLDVAVVSVKVDQLGGNPTPNWEGLFKMILGQALIKVGGNKIQINLSDIDGFRAKFNISNGVIGKTDGLDTDLNRLFNKDYHNLYGKYLLLYFLDVHGPATIQGSIAGYAPINLGRTVLFNGHTKETITHETLHALSLPHSFFYREGLMYLDNNTAKYMDSYVYEAMATDNLMDYSHFPVDLSGNRRTPIDRIQIWMWQWKIIRSHRLINNTFISK